MANYGNHPFLIETEWLAANLANPRIRIVEVDEDTEVYDVSHIPGAIAWHWRDDLHDSLRRDFIDSRGLEQLLARSGIDDETTIVLYAGNNNWFAAYAYWYLKYQGFDNVKLLNGGRKKWELENRITTAERPPITPAAYPPRISGPRPQIRAYRDEVLMSQGTDRALFIDVRSPEEYRGERVAPPHLPQEQAQVPGHIPGAVNIPWNKAADEDGSFKSPQQLKEIYSAVGGVPDSPVIAYCRIGERSSHTWFVLHELLGYESVKNYDGSWTEYGSLVGVPVEREAGKAAQWATQHSTRPI